MQDFEIRRLTSTNAEAAIAALDALLPADWRDGALPDKNRMNEVLADERTVLVVGYAGAKAAGYCSGYLLPAICNAGVTIMLDDVFVAAPFRRQGLGRALVKQFRIEILTNQDRVSSMWAGTGVDNVACQRAFAATGGEPARETYKEYVWREK